VRLTILWSRISSSHVTQREDTKQSTEYDMIIIIIIKNIFTRARLKCRCCNYIMKKTKPKGQMHIDFFFLNDPPILALTIRKNGLKEICVNWWACQSNRKKIPRFPWPCLSPLKLYGYSPLHSYSIPTISTASC